MFPIIFEDNYILVAIKPAGLQAEQDRFGNPSFEAGVTAYLRQAYPWKKQLITGIVHRLDRQVSGLMLIAKTPMALKALSAQFEKRTVRKIYLAVAGNAPADAEGVLSHWLKKDIDKRQAVVSQKGDPNAKECRLRYRVLKVNNGLALLEIELLTGRYHQIRAQLAAIGCPIFGDNKYGSSHQTGQERIYLYAHSLSITHPKTLNEITFKEPPPQEGAWLFFK